ncbi:hypothetical protein MNBD_GAMMA07-587 [hydrothermal vent metagenome]|uniref:Lipopolysaccharide export system protein LptC n=1 Tax=hydrothermal vent metagenome TaxID=652676 RepID=A0A3B0X0Q4_9ZZZZ
MRTIITLTVFIVIAIASYYFLRDLTEVPVVEKTSETHFPDYFMENFSITQMNLQGLPEYQIKSIKMLHYADDDRAELEQPFLTLTQAELNITLQASRATYLEKENIIILHENVIFHRAASKTQSEISIFTDYLKLNTQTYIAETHLAAKIKTSQGELNSIGLILNNMQGTLKLKSQVKGTYETTN